MVVTIWKGSLGGGEGLKRLTEMEMWRICRLGFLSYRCEHIRSYFDQIDRFSGLSTSAIIWCCSLIVGFLHLDVR